MRELDQRLERAVRTFADGADTDVDAASVAHRLASGRGTRHALLGREVPMPVALVVALGLLVLALAGTLAAGAWRTPEARPATDDTLDAQIAALGVPLPTFLPATDGAGDEPTTAREVPTRTLVADGIRFDVVIDANDRRVAGRATWLVPDTTSADTARSGIGPLAGTMHLDGPDGAWDGECTAATGPDGRAMTGSCWLTGSGDHAGLTWFRQFTWRFDPSLGTAGGVSVGMLYPGEPPTR